MLLMVKLAGFDMISYKEALDILAGTEDLFSLEHRIFNCAIAVSIMSLIPGLLFMLFKDYWLVNLVLFAATALYFYIYYLCRFADQLQKAVLVFVITGGSLLNIMWFLDRGALGSTGFFIFIVILLIAFTAQNPFRYLVAMFVNLVVLCILDGYVDEIFHWRMEISTVGQEITLMAAVVYLSILALMYKGLVYKKIDNTYVDVMTKLVMESTTVNKTADQMALTSEHLLACTLQQKTATEQLAVTTEELGATAHQNSQLANSAMSAIKNTEHNILQSQDIIDSLTVSIDKIRQSSEEIQTINNVINDISYQTNILSLNAMIEASRAEGGSGGFKVVALEVKRLSERSAKAADSINKLLANNFSHVKEGVDLAHVMKSRFQDIASAIHPLSSVIQNVNDSSTEQHEAIRQITLGIDDIDRAVGENKQLALESSSTARELRRNAESFIQVVEQLEQSLNN